MTRPSIFCYIELPQDLTHQFQTLVFPSIYVTKPLNMMLELALCKTITNFELDEISYFKYFPLCHNSMYLCNHIFQKRHGSIFEVYCKSLDIFQNVLNDSDYT